MALNISTSNYINTQTSSAGNSANVSGQASLSAESAVVSVKGMDLKPGQTLSGQVVEVDGRDIKLILSNNQTINAKLEGNINALLGQTLSFEVKNTDNGQTALRPLYTNLNNSPAVANALTSAGLPHTENYAKMVSSMMDEGMPINKNALYAMAKNINSHPSANPETVVRLNKLGLQINELTINQYENYKGLERQITGDVDTLTKGLSELLKESLSDVLPEEIAVNTDALDSEKNQNVLQQLTGKNLLSTFLNALSGKETAENIKAELGVENDAGTINNLETDSAEVNNITSTDTTNTIPAESFDTAREILDLIDTNVLSQEIVNSENGVTKGLEGNALEGNALVSELLSSAKDLTDLSLKENLVFDKDILSFAKDIIRLQKEQPEKVSADTRQKLAKLMAGPEFGKIVKDALTKQMLLKPEEAASAKNIDDLYNKIMGQAEKAAQILQNSGKDNPELMNAAKNISDNVTFMNELNQVATYVQLPLLMNGKSAHGDLYVYTKKKSLRENDGNISALLHLDMENLGPMDVYVALKDGNKLNTHFYLQDEATIDFIADHIAILNKRLNEKGYLTDINVTEKNKSKGSINMADEFLKDEPGKEGVTAVKYSFDVRA